MCIVAGGEIAIMSDESPAEVARGLQRRAVAEQRARQTEEAGQRQAQRVRLARRQLQRRARLAERQRLERLEDEGDVVSMQAQEMMNRPVVVVARERREARARPRGGGGRGRCQRRDSRKNTEG